VANGGYHIPPTVISKVVYPNGKVIVLGNPNRTQVFSDGQAYAATQVLKGVITSGTGTSANYGCPAAGKTGTTSNYTDAWFVGYTPKLSTAVWVGYPNATTSMTDVNGLGAGFGGTLAAPIWHTYMQQAAAGYCGDFTPPTVPFVGTPFYGYYTHYALGGPDSQVQLPGTNTTSTTATTPTTPGLTTGGATPGVTTPGVTTPGTYTNPQLYNPTPQTGPATGAGTPPAGFGTGHTGTVGSGGASSHG
jgi:penicillin-binding protein 1A